MFGHDPGIFHGAGEVTKRKYLHYKQLRGSHGQGGMQGVGPAQLTYYTIQDRADKLGGCWRPGINIAVGLAGNANVPVVIPTPNSSEMLVPAGAAIAPPTA